MLAGLETYHGMVWVSDRYGRSGLVTVRSLIITSVLCTAVQCCTVLYSAVLYTVRCYNLCPSVRGCPPIAQHQSGSQYFQRQQNIFAAAVWRLCEVSACTCLATWAGWGSTRPPRPPTGPPASVCLSMLLLTLFSISTGRTTAFCRGFLVVL